MYVRWQERKQQNGSLRWNAVLVENKWVKGKPKQKHLASLGGIIKSAAKNDTEARYAFWLNALAKLSALSPSDQQKIEAALALRVPQPTDEQLENYRVQELTRELRQAEQAVQNIKREISLGFVRKDEMADFDADMERDEASDVSG
jgi:hypothetical protein